MDRSNMHFFPAPLTFYPVGSCFNQAKTFSHTNNWVTGYL